MIKKEDYVGLGQIMGRDPVGSPDPNQSLYRGQHSIEEVLATLDLAEFERKGIFGTQEKTCDINRAREWTKMAMGIYLVFHEAFAINRGIGEFRQKE